MPLPSLWFITTIAWDILFNFFYLFIYKYNRLLNDYSFLGVYIQIFAVDITFKKSTIKINQINGALLFKNLVVINNIKNVEM